VRGEASVGSAMVKRMVSRPAIRSDFKDYFLVIMRVCVVVDSVFCLRSV
jgi:hypothetical protein